MKSIITQYLLATILVFGIGHGAWAKEDAKGAHDKGFVWTTTDGNYQFKVGGMLQPWVQYQLVDGGTNIATFLLRRARLNVGGHVFSPKVLYRFETEFAGAAGGVTATLLDGYVDWRASQYVQLRWGQFKVPFSHEFLSSSSSLQFVDRSIVSPAFALGRDLGRDLGVVWHGVSWGDRIDYDFFAVNGDGINQINLNTNFVLGGRFTWHVLGHQRLGYSDVEHSSKPQFAVAVAGAYDLGNAALTQQKLIRVTTDMQYFVKGFSLAAEGHYVSNTTTNQSDLGLVAQTGYFFVPETFEVAVRWATVGRSTTGAFGTGPVDGFEATGGFGYFFNGHRLKLQGDYGWLINNATTLNRDDQLVRLQLTAVI